MERNLSQGLDCNGQPPTAEQILTEADLVTSTLYAVLTAITLIGNLVYLEEVLYLVRKIPSFRRTAYIWITGAPPVIATTSCVGLWIPRSSMFTDFTASIYFTICIYKFLVMIIEEYGGDEAIVQTLQDVPVKISTGPCCCCCLCLPSVKMTRTTLSLLKSGVLQVALLRPILLFFAIVLWSNGNYVEGEVQIDGAFIWITVLSVVTFILSLWPVGILFNQAKTNLTNCKIGPKFALNQSVLILSQAQSGIINQLVNTGIVECVPPFSSKARGTFMNQQLLVIEMFVITLVSRCYYRRKYSSVELKPAVPEKEDLKVCLNGVEVHGAPQWV
ncbi:organic solute transporter subunit alpha-like [Latimeria chalumnae]|uniref:organic solute transporter subunit alpha-like n=1 Tax=Latimeria chalumnae TaxID=7897 RepID=UPI00313D17D6